MVQQQSGSECLDLSFDLAALLEFELFLVRLIKKSGDDRERSNSRSRCWIVAWPLSFQAFVGARLGK